MGIDAEVKSFDSYAEMQDKDCLNLELVETGADIHAEESAKRGGGVLRMRYPLG